MSWKVVWTAKPQGQKDLKGGKEMLCRLLVRCDQSLNVFSFFAAFHVIICSVEMKGLLCVLGVSGGVININSRADWRQYSSEVAHDDVSWVTPTHRSCPEWRGEDGIGEEGARSDSVRRKRRDVPTHSPLATDRHGDKNIIHHWEKSILLNFQRWFQI